MITGRHVLWGLIGGFGVIFIANGAFVFFAATTFPGNEVDDPYRRGLAYNETLSADRAQRIEGWRADIHASPNGVEIALNREHERVGGLVVAGELRRHGEPSNDRVLIFRENSLGRYQADTELGAGRWDLQIVARNLSGAEVLRLRDSIEIDP